jgi:hypothetical protein
MDSAAFSEVKFEIGHISFIDIAFAHDQFALTLACQGRFAESFAEDQRAAQLDRPTPLSQLITP